MLIRNFNESEYVMEPCHDGKGIVKNVILYGSEVFDTNLKFIIYTELEPGVSIGNHPHGENEEVYVIIEGNGIMTVNGQLKNIKSGDVIVNKPGWSHGLENNSDTTMKILVFEVDKM